MWTQNIPAMARRERLRKKQSTEPALLETEWAAGEPTDDGVLPGLYCNATRADVLNVVAAAPLGLPGANTLRIYELGTKCGNVEKVGAIPNPSQSHYGRVYTRVTGLFNDNKMMTYNTTGVIQLIPMGFDPSGGAERIKLHFLRDQNGNALPDPETWGFYYTVTADTVYRYEWHVEYDTPAAGSLPGSVQFWPRLYNAAGTLIADADDFLASNEASLASYYAGGGRVGITDLTLAQRFSVGIDGNVGYQDPGGTGYLAKLRLQASDWVGA